ncbi:MAG: hypothetical protein IJX05_02895, partial [Clostridia bacterium]|nr:hypothetical protein [Clostridia bacterium]
ILVMTTMMGSMPTESAGGAQMETFTNVWQALGSVSGTSMGMSLAGMCNINIMYFAVAVLVCIFVSDDFRSGYAKNLFAVRSLKTDYVISKTVICFIAGACMLLGFFIGAMIGGGIARLPFEMTGFNALNVIAKQRLWLSILLSLGVSMLLFNIVPMVAPLDSGIINVILSLVGGALFSVGLGAVGNQVLRRTSLV